MSRIEKPKIIIMVKIEVITERTRGYDVFMEEIVEDMLDRKKKIDIDRVYQKKWRIWLRKSPREREKYERRASAMNDYIDSLRGCEEFFQ